MKIIINAVPIPKARHRSFIRGGKVFTYDPQSEQKQEVTQTLTRAIRSMFDSKDKAEVKEASSLAYGDFFEVRIDFYLPYPKGRSPAQKNMALWGLEECNHKPDLDNLAKFYLDCANGIIFPDDSQITSLSVKKKYSNNPKTVIHIMGRKKIDLHDKAKGIFELVNPKEMHMFLKDFDDLYKFCSGFDEEGNHEMREDNPELYRSRLSQAASYISRFADMYSAILGKIHKNHPELWVELSEIETCKAALQNITNKGDES